MINREQTVGHANVWHDKNAHFILYSIAGSGLYKNEGVFLDYFLKWNE